MAFDPVQYKTTTPAVAGIRRRLERLGAPLLEGPLIGEAGTVTAALDLDRIAAGRRTLDPIRHYARPDILQRTITQNGEQND